MPDHLFPCEACGAQLAFAPGQTSLACPSCGHVQEIAAGDRSEVEEALREHDYATVVASLRRDATYEETRAVRCPSCGAQTEFPEGTQAATCPFCATPLVAADAGPRRQIRPAAVIPFQLTEEAARAAMTDWLGSLWLAPNGLREYARKGRRLDGIYVPYWTFDADTSTTYRGQRGDAYYESQTVMRNGKASRVQVRRVRWRGVSGRVARAFDDVLVLASRSLPKAHTDALEPWDLQALAPFRPDYLAGLKAEGYGVELDEAFAEAQGIMAGQIEADIRADIGGDEQRVTSRDTAIRDVRFKHVLLPVWMAAYRYRDRSFRFVVNGQTGRVQGERPWSRWKVAGAVLLALVLAAGLLYGYALTQEGGPDLPRFGDGPSWLNE